jgi:CHASE3 domain sensor protein
MIEKKQLLLKPEPPAAADQPDTIVVQTSTIMRTETEQLHKTTTSAKTSRDVLSIMKYQSYIIAVVIGGLIALLVWVVVLLIRVNRMMVDTEKYIS